MKNFRSLFVKTPRKTKFQINSDLHLEVGQQYSSFQIAPSADYLVLGGDIGRLIDYDEFLNFLEVQTKQFKKVFLVLGNHEFYGNTFNLGLEVARKMEKEPCLNGKMILLHQKRYDMSDVPVTVLGCTLWSKVPQHAIDVVKGKVKDFQKIEGWTVDDHNAAHDSDLSWLKEQVEIIYADKKSKRSILVVTHHAPLTAETSSPQHVNNAWTCAFASDVLWEGNWAGVKSWVFGHTHFTTQFEKFGIKLVSNQRGYILPGGNLQGSKARKDHKSTFDVRKSITI